MEKRNVIAPDRTPHIGKQASIDEMQKEAVDMFEKTLETPENRKQSGKSKSKPRI